MKPFEKLGLRTLFVVALLIVGFGAELLWQRSRNQDGEINSEDGRIRVVFIGSSVASGLAEKVQVHLRRIKKRDDIDVIQMASAFLNSELALLRAKEAAAKYKPRAFLFMLNSQQPVDSAGWLRETGRLVEAGDYKTTAEKIFEKIDDDDYLRPYFLIFRWQDRLKSDVFTNLFLKGLLDRAKKLTDKPSLTEGERNRVMLLARFGLIVSPDSIFGDYWRNAPDDLVIARFKEKCEAIVDRIEAWPREAREKGYVDFVDGGADDLERLVRHWFWASWEPGAANEKQPLGFYYRHIDRLAYVFYIPFPLRAEGAIDRLLTDHEPKAVLKTLASKAADEIRLFPFNELGQRGKFEFENRPPGSEGVALLEWAKTNEIQPFLIHFPTNRRKEIDELGARTGVAVLAGRSPLDDLVKENGRSAYFLDEIESTGHLTEAGLELFGRAIAEELAGARGWDTKSTDEVASAPGVRMVVIGSSVATGLAEKIQHHLRRLRQRDDIVVFEMVSAFLSPERAERSTRIAIDKYSPRDVIYMLNMHEPVDRDGWLSEVDRLADEDDHSALAAKLFEKLDAGDYLRPYLFLFRREDRLDDPRFEKIFAAGLLGRIHAISKRKMTEELRKHALLLIRLAMMVESKKIFGDHVKESERTEHAERFKTRFRSLVSNIERWPAEAKKSGYEAFIDASKDTEDRILRHWFWVSFEFTPRNERHPIEFYRRNVDRIAYVISLPSFLHDERAFEKHLKDIEAKTLARALRDPALQKTTGFPFNHRGQLSQLQYDVDSTLEKGSNLIALAKERGVRPFVAHFPLVRNDDVDAFGGRLGVPVLAKKSRLDELVKRDGRSTYFWDDVEGSGHMTEAGLEIFGREIAAELARDEYWSNDP